MLVLNKDEQIYNKRHLVPFGEYIPFKDFFSYIAKRLNIPMSDLSHGDLNQKPFSVDNITMHPLICYEIAYPSLINMTNDYSVIINISNDAWFGDTFAPYQHLQIAQVRALETAHPIIRAANTGISAIIDKNGLIIAIIGLDTEGFINGKVYPSKGITPYMYFGDYPLLMLIFSIMLFYWTRYRRYE
jgi:apolipoprotein N-acyltransferase